MKKQPFFKMASIDAHRNRRQLLPSSLGPRLLLLTFMITLTCLCTAPTYAAPSSGSDPGLDMDASFFGATDIVRPSIYSYTITNPTKQLLREQDQQQRQQLEQQQKLKQQQQQQQLSSNDIAYSNNNNNKHRNHSNKNNNNNNNNNVNNKNLMNTQNYRSGNTNRNLYYINNNNNNNNVRSNKNKIRSHTHSNNNMSEINSNNNDNNSKISNNNNLKNTYYSSYSPSYAPTLSTPSSYPSGSEFSGVSSPTASISSGFSPSSSFSLSSLSSPVPSNLPAPSASLPVPVSGCNMDRLAVYKVVLHTYWTRDLFPKHFPDWRPTAQWTKTIGRTHDAAYALYHIGQQATSGVKQFAETGKSDIIDSMAAQQQQQQQTQQKLGNSFTSFVPSSGSQAKSTQTPQQQQRQQQQQQQQRQQQQQPLLQNGGERSSVFDEFAIPAITTGAGRSETKFFVDSNHSIVSLMTRIVPSPDWFIGVDSFQLCVGGSWIDTVTIEMDPLDAGTDNGFTFTAPNWPTSPQGVIYRITSRYPAHPAGSFFYPKSKRLPPIATYQLIKLKEYDLSEVFNFAEDDRKYETVRTQTHLETEHNHVEMNNELSASIERERQNEATPVPTSVTERDRIRSELLAKMNPMNNASNVVPKNDKHALMQNIAQSYHRRGGDGRSSSVQSKRRRTRRQRDCRVSHWSEWSACSKSCGIGEMNRYRKVIKHGRRGGRPCPALQESKWCGSEKGCHNPESYFNWSIT